ncbi:hypothetical protein [Noviherbaspirillum pedocola]|uniref:Uncharacterized protein n=1 Tax=Noviherbaspirillum pedocola TaxID=2801341 RepID=A0A934W5Z0_9BURK|nr:hypothetical protein [Noviherbaspirillum pedocola]MBK4733738.1 hypothetical protein [Noviherbaspirillum pedocola]
MSRPAPLCIDAVRGQALTEFLVISLVLLPLFLLLPLIGKIQDIAHQAQLASRYAAFDGLLRNDSHNQFKQPEQLERELAQRFFSAGVAISTEDRSQSFTSRPQWSDPWAHPLVGAATAVRLSFGPSHGKTHRDAFTAASDAERFMLASKAGLHTDGIYNVNVSADVANLPAGLKLIEPFDRLNLRIERHASVLLDAWTANGPAQVERRFGPLAGVNKPLQAIEGIFGTAMKLVDLHDVAAPSFGALERWRDAVPSDRVVPREAAQ